MFAICGAGLKLKPDLKMTFRQLNKTDSLHRPTISLFCTHQTGLEVREPELERAKNDITIAPNYYNSVMFKPLGWKEGRPPQAQA